MQKLLFLFFLIITFSFSFSQTIIKGKIVDQTSQMPVAFATIRSQATNKNTVSDQQGFFRLSVPADTCTLIVSCIGYRTSQVAVPKLKTQLIIKLAQGPVDLKEITISSGIGNNNSFHTISSIDLNLHPLNSSQDLMRLVPGLFLGQHHGGGIAEHIFFRGFDADHGTDVNVSVDEMPLNLVSQIHGQGFSDLHFLIPELMTTYEFGKGPYYAEHGDFTTAGYVAFQTLNVINKSVVKIEGGLFNTGRIMTMLNLLSNAAKLKGESAYIAGEAAYTDGPFVFAQHFSRINLFGKYNVNVSPTSKLTVTLSTFKSKWRSSGEIPERAVDEGLVSRFGYIDSLQGGNTSRTNVIARISTTISDNTYLQNQFYYSRYYFNHHYDDTFFANDSINGDMLRQKETRDLFGYNGRLSHRAYLKNGATFSSLAGLGWQYNRIYNSELSHITGQGKLLQYLQYGNADEMTTNAYVDESFNKGKWLLNAGARLDYFYFNYIDKINPQLPSKTKSIVSPKLNIEYTFNSRIQAYIKLGKGFHSNDAKVVIFNQGREILPAAYGSDIGINWKPMPHLFINAALWYLYLQQEFVYNGDDGTISPGDETRRQGIDFSARYQFTKWLFANVDMNVSKARDIQAAKGNNYLPLAVPASSTGGLDFKFKNGLNGGLSYRYMADRPANEDNSLIAKGYFVTDLTVNYTKKNYEAGLEIQNLLNTKWREEQFEAVSRLKNEPSPIDDINFTAGTPFFAKLKLAVFF